MTARRDVCAACRTYRRVRTDGTVEQHHKSRPSDSGWSWRAPYRPVVCPGSGRVPLVLTPRAGARP